MKDFDADTNFVSEMNERNEGGVHLGFAHHAERAVGEELSIFRCRVCLWPLIFVGLSLVLLKGSYWHPTTANIEMQTNHLLIQTLITSKSKFNSHGVYVSMF